MEIFLQTGGIIDSTGMNHLLTYDQIEAAYRPLVEELEIWLQEQGEAGAGNALYGEAWNALSLGYLHLGEMERCLESRREGYDITEWDFLKLEVCDRTRVIPSSDSVWDEYGRIIESGGGVTYGEADREIRWEESADGIVVVLEYDSLGRVSKSVQTWTDDGYEYVQEYEYEGGNTVMVTGYSTGNSPSYATLSYDEYGRPLNELEWSN